MPALRTDLVVVQAVSLVVAEAARKPVVSQRLTVAPSLVLGDEVRVAIVLHGAGDLVERGLPGDRFELARAGLADHRLRQARFRMDHVEQRRAFRAKRAAIGRVIRIALDVDDVGLLALGEIALQ